MRPRAHFVPHKGSKAKLEIWCKECRKVYRKELLSPAKLKARVAAGKIKEVTANKIIEKLQRKKANAGKRNLDRWRRRKYVDSWRSAQHSLAFASRQLKRYTPPTLEAEAWVAGLREMMSEAWEQIKILRRQEKLPTHKVVLWYDAVPFMAGRLREYLNSFPGNAEDCPFDMVER